jgi:hypothetical protein
MNSFETNKIRVDVLERKGIYTLCEKSRILEKKSYIKFEAYVIYEDNLTEDTKIIAFPIVTAQYIGHARLIFNTL